jgi:tRNA pseudouridine38-40 synthase
VRIVFSIAYDGSPYKGWQRQKHAISVQEHLERAVAIVANEEIIIQCAGRTDAGVHATKQIVHFDTIAIREPDEWLRGVNTYLPAQIRVEQVTPVSDDFNARFSALSRQYCYVIYENGIAPSFLFNQLTWRRGCLNHEAMNQGIQYLLGRHDFSAFRAKSCQSKTSWRTVLHAEVRRSLGFVLIEIKANAFLHHMVRNIAGSLLAVGEGEVRPERMAELLTGKDRSKAFPTAKPNGLYLVDVAYPDGFNVKAGVKYPVFLKA